MWLQLLILGIKNITKQQVLNEEQYTAYQAEKLQLPDLHRYSNSIH